VSFLLVNGLEVPVAIDSLTEPCRLIGDTSEADDGTLRKSEQAIKLDFDFSTTPLSPADARAWACLLRGLGDVWSFDSHLYSSKGVPPSAGNGTQVAGTPKFGSGVLRVRSPIILCPHFHSHIETKRLNTVASRSAPHDDVHSG